MRSLGVLQVGCICRLKADLQAVAQVAQAIRERAFSLEAVYVAWLLVIGSLWDCVLPTVVSMAQRWRESLPLQLCNNSGSAATSGGRIYGPSAASWLTKTLALSLNRKKIALEVKS
jgi:hypothetical protein